MAIKVLERKPLSLAERTYLPQIIGGLGITMKNMLKPAVTLNTRMSGRIFRRITVVFQPW